MEVNETEVVDEIALLVENAVASSTACVRKIKHAHISMRGLKKTLLFLYYIFFLLYNLAVGWTKEYAHK